MGQRFYNDRYPTWGQYARFTQYWWGRNGKALKRRLHKTERQAVKREISGLHIRKGYSGAVSDVHYRGW